AAKWTWPVVNEPGTEASVYKVLSSWCGNAYEEMVKDAERKARDHERLKLERDQRFQEWMQCRQEKFIKEKVGFNGEGERRRWGVLLPAALIFKSLNPISMLKLLACEFSETSQRGNSSPLCFHRILPHFTAFQELEAECEKVRKLQGSEFDRERLVMRAECDMELTLLRAELDACEIKVR
ncbi:unnamed protein product, partial [Closterium sp. NIES-54]